MSINFTIAGENVSVSRPLKPDHLKELGGLTFFGGTPDTDGRSRIYGGDSQLVHVKDGTRAIFGARVAEAISQMMRDQAVADGLKSREEADAQALCPGCYMIVLFNAAVALACANGQSLAGLGHTMTLAFNELRQRAELGMANCKESIHVFID